MGNANAAQHHHAIMGRPRGTTIETREARIWTRRWAGAKEEEWAAIAGALCRLIIRCSAIYNDRNQSWWAWTWTWPLWLLDSVSRIAVRVNWLFWHLLQYNILLCVLIALMTGFPSPFFEWLSFTAPSIYVSKAEQLTANYVSIITSVPPPEAPTGEYSDTFLGIWRLACSSGYPHIDSPCKSIAQCNNATPNERNAACA